MQYGCGLVLKYLSEQWLQEADKTLRASGLCASNKSQFVVEQRIDDVVFQMIFEPTGARICVGAVVAPVVVFTQSRETAVAIATGDLSAEDAVLNGLTVVEGDPLSLLAQQQVLAQTNDVFAELRAVTDWD